MIEAPVREEAAILIALGRLEGKMDGFLASQERQEGFIQRQEVRIRSLETWKSRIIGITLAVGVIVAGSNYALHAFKGFLP